MLSYNMDFRIKKVGMFFLIFVFSIMFVLSFDLVAPSKDKPIVQADLWPTINIYASSNEVNTTVTITVIANDYGSNAGLLWIKLYENNSLIEEKNCNNQPSCPLVKDVLHNQPGYYEYYAKTKDIGGHEKSSEKVYVKFNGINQPPIIINYTPENLTPQVYENSSLYFEVIAYDPNNDPLSYKFLLDGQVVSNTNNFLYKPGFFDSGLHEVLAIVNDNKGGVATLKWNVTVINVLIPTQCNLNFNPESPIVYGQGFKAYCSCNNPEAQAEMWRDGVNVTNEIGLIVYLAAKPSGYLYVCNVSETQNYANASVEALYIINKANHTAHLALNNIEANIEVTYPTVINATGWLEINQGTSNAILLRNGSIVASGSPATEIVLLPVGFYNYTYYYPESQNYTQAIITRFVTVKKNQTILNLTAYPSWQVVYGTPVNVSCEANNNEVLLNLYRNNTLVASGYGLVYDYIDPYKLAAGEYLYVCNTSGSQNYSAASVSNVLKINKAQTILNLTAYPSWQVVYGTQTTVTCVANHNQTALNLYRNNIPVNNPDIAILAAGNYIYVCNISESQNYTSASISSLLTVNKANATVNLLLNGIDGDINVSISEIVFAEGFLNLSQGNIPHLPKLDNIDDKKLVNTKLMQGPFTIYLYVDGNVVANGDYYLNYTTKFNQSQTGMHNFTLYFHGNENYTSAYETHFVNVLPDTQSPNVTIYSPVNQTYNTNIIELNYSVEDNIAIDSCWYSLNNQNFSLPNCQNTTLILDNGFYHLIVYANDTSNNIGYDEVYFTVAYDIQPPLVYIESPLNQTYNTSYIWINITANDNVGIDRIWYRINYGENVTYTNPIFQYFDNGNYILEAWANDTSNNIGYAYVYFNVNTTLDTIPPSILFVPPTPENNSIVNKDWIYVNASVSDNVEVDSCLLEWNGSNESMIKEGFGSNVICYINVSGLSDGLYSYKVYANDTSNNWNVSEIRYVTVNTTPPNFPPVVNLISPLNNTIFHNQQNVNFSYIATDDNDLSFLCTIFLDSIANQSQITQNNTITNFTINGIAKGIHSWHVECIDSSNLTGISETWLFTIALHDVEIVANYTNSINGIRITMTNGTDIMDDPANLSQNETYFIRYRINNNGYPEINREEVNVSVWLVNATGRYLISSYLKNISQYHLGNVTFDTSGFAPGEYNITVNVTIINYTDINPADNERNRTVNIVQIDLPPWWLNETVMPPSPAVYGSGPYNFSIEWYDNNAVMNVIFEFDNYNYTPTCNPQLPTNATTCYYWFDDLAVGIYEYKWYAKDTSLWNSTPMLNYTINKAQTILNLTAYPSWQVVYGTPVNISCEANNNEVLLNLYRNNTLVVSGYGLIYDYAQLPVGNYVYVCNTSGSQNYSAANVSNVLIVTELLPGEVRLWIDGIEGNVTKVYSNQTIKVNASTPYGNVSLYRNGILLATSQNYVEVNQSLPAGIYNFTAYSSGDNNHSPASITYFLTINKANSSLRLYLNGIEGDIEVLEGENVNITAILEIPTTGNIFLLENGTQIAYGPSPLTKIKSYTPGYYNITSYYLGNENYTSSTTTHFIKVIQAIHDVGVVDIWQTKINGMNNITTYLNDSLNVSATIKNFGNVDEGNVIINFTDTYFENNTLITKVIGIKNISLSVNESKIVSFNYTAKPKGIHTLKIEAIIENDNNPANDFKTLELVVWSVNDIVSNDTREIFIDNMNPRLNTIFTVYLPIQNNFANQEFYDFPALLTISPNNLLPLDPMQNYSYLAPGGFVVVSWRVNATSPGVYYIGAIEGVDELIIPSKQINVTE